MSAPAPAPGSSRRQGTLKWKSAHEIGFVREHGSNESAILLPWRKPWLCNVEWAPSMQIEYSLAPGKKRGSFQVVDALPIIKHMRMGEAVALADQPWTLESGIRKEEATWRQSNSNGTSSTAGSALSPDAAYVPHRLMYIGLSDPSNISRATLSASQLIDGPAAWLDLPTGQLPRYTPLRQALQFTPDYTEQEPARKPTIMAAFMGAMEHVNLQEPSAPGGRAADPVAALQEFGVITGRHQLQALMELSPTGSLLLYAYRPFPDGPLVLERGKMYGEMSGSIGRVLRTGRHGSTFFSTACGL